MPEYTIYANRLLISTRLVCKYILSICIFWYSYTCVPILNWRVTLFDHWVDWVTETLIIIWFSTTIDKYVSTLIDFRLF